MPVRTVFCISYIPELYKFTLQSPIRVLKSLYNLTKGSSNNSIIRAVGVPSSMIVETGAPTLKSALVGWEFRPPFGCRKVHPLGSYYSLAEILVMITDRFTCSHVI